MSRTTSRPASLPPPPSPDDPPLDEEPPPSPPDEEPPLEEDVLSLEEHAAKIPTAEMSESKTSRFIIPRR
jgi:hypothetical protein